MKRFACAVCLVGLFFVNFAQADHGPRPDDHAPIGVMGDHTHLTDEVMFSYRYSNMRMQGNRSGSDDVSLSAVLDDFMVTPTKMTMEMHMFGMMVGATDQLTWMVMIPYVHKQMDHVNRVGVEFTTETKGFGDTKLTRLYEFYDDGKHRFQVNGGVSLPTGSIDKEDTTPAGFGRLPYPMQLGSGTYDLLGAVLYNGKTHDWSWGGQVGATIRTGKNNNSYSLGNEYNVTMWGARKVTESVSISARLDGKAWGEIDGADPTLNTMMVPTARADLRGGERVDALIGINFIETKGKFKDHRLALELGTPIFQRLDGPQLETDYRLMLGWQYSF